MGTMICRRAIPEPSAPHSRERSPASCRVADEVQIAMETSFHYLRALVSSVLALNSPAMVP